MVTWKCPKCGKDFVTDHANPGPTCAFCADPKAIATPNGAYHITLDPGSGKDQSIVNLVMICRRLARMADPAKRASGMTAREIVQHAYRIADEAGVDARPSPLRDEYTEGAANDDGSDPRPKELQF